MNDNEPSQYDPVAELKLMQNDFNKVVLGLIQQNRILSDELDTLGQAHNALVTKVIELEKRIDNA